MAKQYEAPSLSVIGDLRHLTLDDVDGCVHEGVGGHVGKTASSCDGLGTNQGRGGIPGGS